MKLLEIEGVIRVILGTNHQPPPFPATLSPQPAVPTPNLAPITDKLSHAQANFLRASDTIPSDLWRTRPPAGGWCPAEIVAHLCQVERAILSTADRIVRHPPRRVPLLKRFHLPMFMVEKRLVRRKTPIALDPELLAEKETMLAELRSVRERTFAFLEETAVRDLSPYYWPHPFLGMLNAYRWFEMIAAHQIRHTRQVQRIPHGLPKDVVSSQK